MKVIQLLNKIANGEEVPKKIKVNDNVYEYRSFMYCTEKANYQDLDDYLFGKWNFLILNNEVEIIEDKKIEKFPYDCFADDLNKNEEFLVQNINQIKDKVNEIIDIINKKK